MTYDEFERETARVLKVYDADLMYSWTYGEWSNRIIGANLAILDAHDLAVKAAWVGGAVARQTQGRAPLPEKFFDVERARQQLLTGTQGKKEPDFTFYDRMKEGLENFDWAKHFVPKN